MNFLIIRESTILLIIALLILFGLYQLNSSNKISEFIEPENFFYDFSINMHPKDKPLNEFLLRYDFSRNQGNISFLITFVDPIDAIVIELPKIINKGTLSIDVLECDLPISFENVTCEKSDIKLNYHFANGSGLYHRWAILILENLPSLSSKVVSINFESNLKPVGTFQIYSDNRNKIYQSRYAIDFILGDKFICPSSCYENVRGTDIYFTSFAKKLKVKFTADEVDSYIFKMEGVSDKEEIVKKQNKLVLGTATLSVGVSNIILYVTYWLRKETDTRKTPEEFKTKPDKQKTR